MGSWYRRNVFMYRPKHSGGFRSHGHWRDKTNSNIRPQSRSSICWDWWATLPIIFPGCPGVGEKTAQSWWNLAASKTCLPTRDQLKGALKTKVEAKSGNDYFPNSFATIKADKPIKLDMTNTSFAKNLNEELRKIFEELEFLHLIDRVWKNQVLPPPSNSVSPDLYAEPCFLPVDSPTRRKQRSCSRRFVLQILRPTGQAIRGKFKSHALRNASWCRLSTHWYRRKKKKLFKSYFGNRNSLNRYRNYWTEPMEAELVGMSFSNAENRAYYVPCSSKSWRSIKIVNEFHPLYENEKSWKWDKISSVRYSCPSKLRSAGERWTFRHHARPLRIATGTPSQHGLPCRNLICAIGQST